MLFMCGTGPLGSLLTKSRIHRTFSRLVLNHCFDEEGDEWLTCIEYRLSADEIVDVYEIDGLYSHSYVVSPDTLAAFRPSVDVPDDRFQYDTVDLYDLMERPLRPKASPCLFP